MKQKENQEQRKQWEIWIAEREASGVSIQKWCKEKQMPTSRYYYWKKRIQKTPEQTVRFEEITLEKEMEQEQITKPREFIAAIQVKYRQYEVLISETADSTQIITVLEALKKIC